MISHFSSTDNKSVYFFLFFIFFSTRPSPGFLPVLGPLGSGRDTTHQPCPAIRLLCCWWSRVECQVVWLMLLLCERERLISVSTSEQSIYHTQAGFEPTKAEWLKVFNFQIFSIFSRYGNFEIVRQNVTSRPFMKMKWSSAFLQIF